ncbi:MAG: OstA-like protein [Bacteroidia bacterium]
MNKITCIFIFIFFTFSFLAQTKKDQKAVTKINQSAVVTPTQAPVGKTINIKHANSLSFDREKSNAKVLTGNVVCEHDGAILNCDSALIYDGESKMQASGHIVITKGDSITVTGDKLFYDGKTKLAALENNVKCVEKDMTLTTNHLTFDVGNSIANYYDGGTIVNKENTLTSKIGHYYSATKDLAFHYDVVLTNPQYTMKSDTLRYNTVTKTAFFLGPSIIMSKTDYIYCENGYYDTDKELGQFSVNALLMTSQQKLTGDSLFFDRNTKIGRAFRNVRLIDTAQKSIIFGGYAEFKEKRSEALVTINPVYARIVDNDTLFIAADTLYHRDLDSVDNFLNAYHHVKIFKTDMQAKADSASLNTKDSLLQLFRNPVLWSNRSQATAKMIKIYLGKNTVNGFKLESNSFLINQADTIDKFNQLSGRSIEGFIRNDTVRKVIILGNAEALYYVKNKASIAGLNKTTCTEINMWFKNADIDRVTLKPNVEGTVTPLKDVDPEGSKIKGFNWQYDKRPKSRWELHQKEKSEKIKPTGKKE